MSTISQSDLEADLIPDQAIKDQAAATTFADAVASATTVTAQNGGLATVRISLVTTATLELRVIPYGASAEVTGGLFNDGNTLTAGNGYTFDFAVTRGAKYGFRVGTTQVGYLQIACTTRLV